MLEPVFSGAYLLRPLKKKSWVLGLLSDGIHGRRFLRDPAGHLQRIQVRFFGEPDGRNLSMPVIDRYSGENSMYHEDISSPFSSFRSHAEIDIGLRLARVFHRDGAVGSTNNTRLFILSTTGQKSKYLKRTVPGL